MLLLDVLRRAGSGLAMEEARAASIRCGSLRTGAMTRLLPLILAGACAFGHITVDYPQDGTVFPPEFTPPEFVWRDAKKTVTLWTIEMRFADGGPALPAVRTRGPRMRLGEIDPRAVSDTNAPPKLSAEQTAAHTWRPEAGLWKTIKARSVNSPATITITGYAGARAVSKAEVRIQTSAAPVGAPVFYRDVPLMPSRTEKGIIKPLAESAIPIINWRLRNMADTASRIVMTGLYTCANCHSFAADGKTMGLDVDGPQNDKGLYAVLPVKQQMAIRNEDVVAWSTFRGKLGGKLRVGFMSQVSPDGRYVATTINDTGADESEYQRRKNNKEIVTNYYVANFRDYRFLQVFYPTRGVIAWYSRETGKLQPLPGADDPHYVQTNAVWSPDGKYLVFARAEAKDPYPPGGAMAEYANDPKETQMQYSLYRLPFNEGRGGKAEPIRGASHNAMSNSFPKISPDGRWIVFVKAKNGLLMRPDSELWIVPAEGGEARRMRCNTRLMNSWHSFSPNGRWMVFSSKSRSPYTEMFLTHIDENGNDSPAVLIENSKAANRAVNIPEFVNADPDGIDKIDPVVTFYYAVADKASKLMNARRYDAAATEWQRAIQLNDTEALAHNNLGFCLAELNRMAEAIAAYEKALALSPEYPEANNNLGSALMAQGLVQEATERFRRAVELKPGYGSAHSNLGAALAQQNRLSEAVEHFRKGAELSPESADARNNLGVALAVSGQWDKAAPELEDAVRLSDGREPMMLDLLAMAYGHAGDFRKAAAAARRGAVAARARGNAGLTQDLLRKAAAYERGEILR
jgi:Flp pilus assembly protein TadD